MSSGETTLQPADPAQAGRLFANDFQITDLLVFDNATMRDLLEQQAFGLKVEDLAWSVQGQQRLIDFISRNLPRQRQAQFQANSAGSACCPTVTGGKVRFRSLSIALRCVRHFYARSRAVWRYLLMRRRPEIPFSLLGLTLPRDYCWLKVEKPDARRLQKGWCIVDKIHTSRSIATVMGLQQEPIVPQPLSPDPAEPRPPLPVPDPEPNPMPPDPLPPVPNPIPPNPPAEPEPGPIL